MTDIRKSWWVSPKAGSFDRLQILEDSLPEPDDHQVIVDVKAFGLNFADLFAVLGLYSATPKGKFIPGLEFSGVIRQTGAKVSAFKPGQRVMGITRFGGYTTQILTNEQYIVPLKGEWSFEEGAAYLVQVFTAYYGLVVLGRLKKGETVLIHSAAGGVGLWANRIAKSLQSYTIGTVGNESKLEVLKKEGYDQGMVRTKSFRQDLKKALDGRDLNVIMECIGGKTLMDGYLNMASEGRMVVYGSAHYAQPGKSPNWIKLFLKFIRRPKIDPQRMIEQNKGIIGFNLIYLFEHTERMIPYLAEIDKMEVGKPIVNHVFEFDQIKEALELFLSGKTVGKVVITT